MRANFIELPAPVSDHYSAFGQRVEHLPSEAFSAELVVEAFHVAVLPGTTRIDVERLDLRLLHPVSQEVGDKLRSVIGSNIVRGSMLRDELFHHLAHLAPPPTPAREAPGNQSWKSNFLL